MDDHEAHEVAGAIPALLLSYVRSEAGAEAAHEVLRRAGLPGGLDDQQHRWISHAALQRVYAAVIEVTGDADAIHTAATRATEFAKEYTLISVLRAVGDPRRAYRSVPRFAPRLSRTWRTSVRTPNARTAEVELWAEPGFELTRHDCVFARGLLEVVPTLFGRPPGRAVQTQCQADGSPRCRIRITFEPTRRFGRRSTGGAEIEVGVARAQVEQLQLAAADLVGSEDVTEAIDRMVERAVTAVLAPSYLFVLVDDDGAPSVVRHRGLSEDAAARLAPVIAAGDVADAGLTVVDVASRRRLHGRFAVVHGPGSPLSDVEIPLLQAYASHAAAALDLLTALEESRQRGKRTEALLALAESLAAATDEADVGRVVSAALREVAGCDSASVFVWEPSMGELRRTASSGLREEAIAKISRLPLRIDDVPELGPFLARRERVKLVPESSSARVRALMAAIDSDLTMAIPLVGGDTLLGIATANWADRAGADEDAIARAMAVSRQGGTALEKARLIDTVRHQAQHDSLSGLPNRGLFTKVLGERLRAAGRDDGIAVLFCDLDRFKVVNDELGHAAGDELLRQVAARLRAVCRPTDVLGRLSGDEFALVVQHVDEPAAVAVAQRVIEALEPSFRIEGRELRITVSVGVALHEGTDGWGDRLLAAAADSMHVAKSRGRNQIAVAGMVADRMIVPSLEAELGRAVGAGQLRLYFQPLVDVSEDGRPVVIGAEALLRWAHPRLGLLAPGAFLPLAEEAGLVTELDLWAIDAACAALAQWSRPGDGAPLTVAVNLAGGTLVDPRLAGAVRAALRAHDLDAARLHLEVVESRSLVDLPGVIEHLAELRQMGVRIALDDFGTGYSTLAWLQALPVDQVKIDRSFVRRLPDDPASLAVVRGVVALASEIGLHVVAEGVETDAQLEALRSAGCRWVQGYLLGRPAPILDTALSATTADTSSDTD